MKAFVTSTRSDQPGVTNVPLTEQQRKEQDERIARVNLANMQTKVENLIREAEVMGFVITIETAPMVPLAMRNYVMVGSVRRTPVACSRYQSNVA